MKCGEGKTLDGRPLGCDTDIDLSAPLGFVCSGIRCLDCGMALCTSCAQIHFRNSANDEREKELRRLQIEERALRIERDLARQNLDARSEARERLAHFSIFLRMAAIDAQAEAGKDGSVKLAIAAERANKTGKIIASFDWEAFMNDWALVIEGPDNDKVQAEVRAESETK